MDFTVDEIRKNLIESPYLSSMFSLYTHLSESVSGKRILDFGCGYGWGCYELSEKAANVMGYDRDALRIKTAQSWYSRNNLTFVSSWRFVQEQIFDIVILFFVISYETNEDDIAAIVNALHDLKGDGFRLCFAVKNIYKDKADLFFSLLSESWKKCRVIHCKEHPLFESEKIIEYSLELR